MSLHVCLTCGHDVDDHEPQGCLVDECECELSW